MLSRHVRVALLVNAIAIASLAFAGEAVAIIPSSQITTPAATTYMFGEASSKLTVSGTSVALAEVSIRCYSGPGEEFSTLAENVLVVGGTFTAEVPTRLLFTTPCQLRAVPQGSHEKELGPGSKSLFEGPLLVVSKFLPEAANYSAVSSTLGGAFYFESAGHFGLESSLYSEVGHIDQLFFFGEADLTGYPPIETRSALQVDGANAFVPYSATEVEGRLEKQAKTPVSLTGKPSVTVTNEFNEATHQITIHEEDPVVKCTPSVAYPPTFASKGCTGFVSTGVTLVRTWQTSNEDHLAQLTDTWRSTDGAAHTVNARYYTELTGSNSEGEVFQFPGAGAFAPTHKGETKTLPAGAGAILIKSTPGVSEAGDGRDPQGAIAYDSAPSEPIAVTKGSAGSEVNVLEMPYERTVPAGGSSPTLRMAFTQSFALPEARALAEAAIASYYPSVSIAAPANGTVTSSPTVTVSGSASDAIGLSSLTVNGKAVGVGAGGMWSTSVALNHGANTITATATNQSGLSKSSSVLVTYNSPPPTPPAVARQLGLTRGAAGKVALTIACKGKKGQTCLVVVTLQTVEKLHGKRLIGIAAKTRSKKVTVGSLKLTIVAGQRAKIALTPNATGRRLLRRFGKLPVHLTVTSTSEGVKTTVVAQNLIVHAVHKHR